MLCKIVRATDNPNIKKSMINGEALIEYHVGQFATSPQWLIDLGFYPTYFQSLKMALKYYKTYKFQNHDPLEIWRIEVKRKIKNILTKRRADWYNLEKGIFRTCDFPYCIWELGSRMARKIKLIRKVEV